MDDGTQTFTCKIPKFYIDPKTNQKVINPRWENEASVILAENTHVLKVFIQQGDNLKVFPFIIDKITDRRDSHFSVFKEVEANGLAFSDLGKVGYKLELNSHTLESDYEKDNTVVATIDYWLDKVFPNTKDSNGNIVSWNTPWCYEIKMDWSYFSSERDSTKVYENSYTGSWIYDPNISPTELIPNGTVEGKEKARYINCINSNKYNITQTIAETFEVFCRYEYACESNGKFIKEYTDENGKVWTGKKVVFYNKAIKTENPLVIDYQKNLDTITRTADSTDIYTKLFVVPVESVAMNDGYVTIASTQANPILDDFILNFDYLDSVGSISDYQKQFINEYKIQMRLINQELISLGEDIEVSTVDLNTLEAQSAFIEAQQSSLKEQLDYYQGLRDNEVINTPVTRGKDNSYSVVFVKDNVTGNLTASFHGLEGIDSDTIKGYKDFTYEEEKLLFGSVEVASSISEVTKNKVVYALLGEDGFPASLVAKEGGDISLGTVYIGLTYLPKNKYDKLVNSAQALLDQSAAELDDYENEETGKVVLAKAALEEKEQLYNDKLLEKAKLNEKLERILGPALREGNWQTDNYEDPKKSIVAIVKNGSTTENNVEFIFDQEPFESEQKAYMLVGNALGGQDKHYFHYLNAEDFSFENNRLEDLVIRLRRDFTYTVQDTDEKFLEIEFLKITVPFKGQKIVRYVELTSPLKVGDEILLNYRGNTNELYINEDQQIWYEGEAPDDSQVWDVTQKLAYHKEDSDFYESLEGSLGEYFLYYGSGFKPAFYNINEMETTITTPVLLIVGNSLLKKEENSDGTSKVFFDYEAYNFISYSFIGKPEVYDIGSLEGNLIKPNEETHTLVYPRIHINAENVQYNSDLMTLKLTGNDGEVNADAPQLKKFEDYMVLSRKGQAYITLKVTQNNTFDYILNGPYRLDYQISHANEMLYLDAIQVAKDNSHPRYSYELKLANLPHEFAHVGLSEMVYINDHAMGIHAATGYISEVEYDLDEPQNDNIVIQNYKTKFEDLFHTITAQSEAMRKNSPKYDIAASGFTPNGSIAGSVLQQSLNNTQVYLDYSGTGVQITPQDGIILTNTQPYLNGVYGQIKLQGGGIFISSSVDENGNRIWSSSITPLGINANLLTAGQINTENIRIYSGDNMAFQWNPEGIFAYKNVKGELNPNVYVKYSQNGIHLIDNTLLDNTLNPWDEKVYGEQALVSLDWDGLTLRNKEGQKTLFAEATTGNLTLRGTLKSYDYHEGESRLLSTGWKIEAGGYAEFNDLFVRGTISASVFEYEETSAVGGRLLVSPTFILKGEHTNQAQIEIDTDSPLTITVPIGVSIKDDKFSAGGRTWKINDVIIFNGKFINKDALKVIKQGKDVSEYPIYEIKQLQMKITELDAKAEKPTITLTSSAPVDEMTQNLFYGPDGNIADTNKAIQALGGLDNATGTGDWHLISFGTYDAEKDNFLKEGILLTAIEPNSGSYIDILGKGTDKSEDSTRVRLGDLSSLAANEELVEALGSTPSGWGLYADNVYLRGAIYATSGRIGSLSIDEVENGVNSIKIRLESSSGLAFKEGVSTTTILQGTITTSKGTQIASADAFADKGITIDTLTYQLNNGSDWITLTGGAWSDRQFIRDDIVMNSSIKYRIYLEYTSNNIKNMVYSNELSFTSSGTTITNTETKYAVSSSGTTPPSNDDEWLTSIKTTTVGEFLWTRVTITYSDGESTVSYSVSAHGATGPQGLQGPQGINGDSAVNYNIVTNVSTIARDVQPPLSVNSLIIGAKKVIGKNETTITDLSSEGLTITCQNMTTNSNGEILLTDINSSIISTSNNQMTLTLNDTTYGYQKSVKNQSVDNDTISNLDITKAGAYANITGIKITLKLQDAIVHTVTIPFTIGDNLSTMGMIQNGKVVVDGGLLAANTVAAYSIIAGSITTKQLEVGTITSGFNNEHTDKIQFTEAGLEMTGGTIKLDADSNLNLTGGSINLDGGIFTTKSENFNIDGDGNVTIKGNITATSGTIGPLTVGEEEDGDGKKDDEGNIITYPILTMTTSENQTFTIRKDSITFGEGGVSLSADGIISGKSASFDSLVVGGRDIMALGTTRYVVSNSQPEGHDLLWFEPESYQTSTSTVTWTTDNGRGQFDVISDFDNEYNGTLLMKDVKPIDVASGSDITYTLTLNIIATGPQNYKDVYITPWIEDNQNRKLTFNRVKTNWTQWKNADVIFTATTPAEINFFEPNDIDDRQITLYYRADQPVKGLYLQSNSQIILTAKTNTNSTQDKQKCSVYYIP